MTMRSSTGLETQLGQGEVMSTIIQVRQVNVIIGSDPSATISSLSSALVTAQASISMLAAANQQLQLSSVSAMASAQAAAQASVQASAAAALASLSSSAAIALASASSAEAEASAMAMAASQSADAARADASLVRTQLEAGSRVMTAPTGFSRTQIIIAVVLSVVGTLLLSTAGFAILYKSRRRGQQLEGGVRDLKSDLSRQVEKQRVVEPRVDNIARAMSKDEDNEDNGAKDGEDRKMSSHSSQMEERVDWPFSVRSPGPLTGNSMLVQNSPGLSLFPKTAKFDEKH